VTASAQSSEGRATGPAEKPPAGRGHLQSAFEDPLSALPETAQKLLLAAKAIIANDGFHALTLNAVSTSPPSSIP
jgi:AcrR family transcriptional regulator